MIDPIFEVWLSSDGKHTIKFQAENQEEMRARYKEASVVYKMILSDFGRGTNQGEMLNIGERVGTTVAPKNIMPNTATATDGFGGAVCPVHKTAMKLIPAGVSKKSGKPYDAFYTCDIAGCKQTVKA